MTKKRIILSLSLSVLFMPNVFGQVTEKGVEMSWYGFVNNQFYFDDRVSLQGAADLFNVMPYDVNPDSKGHDINDHSSMSMLAITTRLGAHLYGPDILNAATTGQFEADFTGFSGSNTMFSIRQANFKLNWGSDVLTFGQTWHPMSGGVIPEVIGISMGSPFNPFNRSPQIRYDKNLMVNDSKMRLTMAVLYQFQYSSIGPNGRSYEYQKNSLTPEVYLGADLSFGDLKIGVGGQWLRIAPRTMDSEDTNKAIKTYEYVSSISGMIQAAYTRGKLSLKTKTVWGENMSHLGIASGYGASSVTSSLGYDWSPLIAVSSWVMATYGGDLKCGLFLGYMENLGSEKSFLTPSLIYVYGGNSIDKMNRIAPNVSYSVGNFNVGLEYERTSVSYGTVKQDGTVGDTHKVNNNRVLFSTTYNF